MVLDQVFLEETIIVELESSEKDELFEEMVEAAHSVHPELDRAEAVFALNERESKMTTGIMHSVAIPHAQVKSVKGTAGVIGISHRGIDYDSLDKAPVHLVFMMLAGENQTERHVQILKSLALILQKDGIVDAFLSCKTKHDVYNLLVQSEEDV